MQGPASPGSCIARSSALPSTSTTSGNSHALWSGKVTLAEGGTRRPVPFREIRSRGLIRQIASLFGPGFVTAVAYVDPGNFATNLAGGAEHGYELVWVIVTANLTALGVQYLSAKVGLATGRSLPQLCRDRLSRRVNLLLWLQAEIVVMATDLAEFVGASLGINLVFGIPMLVAGLITALVSFAVLRLEQQGHRRFEVAITALLAVVGLGFLYLFATTGHENYAQIGCGLVPHLADGNSLELAVAITGATIMPHAVFAHSALQTNRVRAAGPGERRTLLTFSKWDCITGLGLAGVVNLVMLCLAAALSHGHGLSGPGGIVLVHARLATLFGGGCALIFAVTLMASGLSSSTVGTYAGQVVMAGFTNWQLPLLGRRALTMLPALIVIAFAVNPGQALVYSQVVLSFGVPFALICLLIVTRDRRIMTDMTNRRPTTVLMLITTVVITGLNLYLLYDVGHVLLA
jgi:manganese transport protein